MTFVRDPYDLKVGDRIRLKRNVKAFDGTFTKGHEFVLKKSVNGFTPMVYEDDNGKTIAFFYLKKRWYELRPPYELVTTKNSEPET